MDSFRQRRVEDIYTLPTGDSQLFGGAPYKGEGDNKYVLHYFKCLLACGTILNVYLHVEQQFL